MTITFAELPPMVTEELLTPEEILEWKNNPNGELCFGYWKMLGRYLWLHRGDDFPTDAVSGSSWCDASGNYWDMLYDGRWISRTTGKIKES